MYFPTANIEVNPLIPPVVAFAIAFFTSMGGLSGAFLILPFQMSFLKYNTPSVSATNQLFNIIAIPSGVYRYVKEGRMVWPLVRVVVVGTLPGVLIGAIVRIKYLPDPKHFKVFAGFVLLYIASRMIKDLLTQKKTPVPATTTPAQANKEAACKTGTTFQVRILKASWRTISYEFCGNTHTVNGLAIMTLSAIVGIIGGIYGIGGGAMLSPFFVTFFGLPVHSIAGATLMGTFVTSVAGVIFYQGLALIYPNLVVAPDWLLGILFGIGGMAGMYCGARCQRFIPARIIKWILVVCLLVPAIRYIFNL
ncbi:MAG: sulfite exporter TauE/SafE family protein [Dissulfuribacterales bacterium]